MDETEDLMPVLLCEPDSEAELGWLWFATMKENVDE